MSVSQLQDELETDEIENKTQINSLVPFCICCLQQTGPCFKLTGCRHADYLDMFEIPDLKPPLNKVVCIECHTILIKINKFKLQVQDSLALLLNQASNIDTKRLKESNIKLSKIVHLNISDINENVPTIENNKTHLYENQNIKTALDIINTNTTNLNLLTSSHLKGITDAMIAVASGSINIESITPISIPTKHQNDLIKDNNLREQAEGIKKKLDLSKVENIYNSMLPVHSENQEENIRNEIESVLSVNHEMLPGIKNESELVENESSETNILPLIKNAFDIEETEHLDSIDTYSHMNPATMIPLKNLNDTVKDDNSKELNKEIEEKLYFSSVENINNSMLPVYNKNQRANTKNVVNQEMVPGTKNVPESVENESIDSVIKNVLLLPVIKNEVELEETDSLDSIDMNTAGKDGADSDTDSAYSKHRFVPIKLKKKELLKERENKLISRDFLRYTYKCNDCIVGFEYEENLQDHNKRKHEMKEGCVPCEFCKQCVPLNEQRRHQSRHFNRLECFECKKRFTFYNEAFQHYKNEHLTNKRKTSRQLETSWTNKKWKYN